MGRLFRRLWFEWLWWRNREFKGQDKDYVRALFYREIDAVCESVRAFMDYQNTEAEILAARLSRRYDPGMALNDATNRALAAKKAAGELSPDNLTSAQKVALEFQKKFLNDLVRKS